jgi:hypothetical protein
MAIDFGCIAVSSGPDGRGERDLVVELLESARATSTGMLSAKAIEGLRAIGDVGHHARPLVELDDGDRIGRAKLSLPLCPTRIRCFISGTG